MDQANFYNFSNMHIDLSKVSAGQTVLEVYPELIHYIAYTQATDLEVRLAILMCDPRGPFSTIKNYITRLENVCRWLKIPMTGEDTWLYDGTLKLTNEHISEIWTQYLSTVFNHEWTSWFSNSIMYYQMMEQLRKPINFTKDGDWTQRQTIETRADSIYNRMKKMEEIIFVDEAIKRKSFESSRDKIENYAEKHSDANSVI